MRQLKKAYLEITNVCNLRCDFCPGSRREPGFLCRPLVARETVQAAETDELIGKLFDGSADQLFASLLGRKKLSAVQIERLREMVKEME